MTENLDRKTPIRHGMYGSAEYRAWQRILQRCTNKRLVEYKNYGGRGIRVCDRWREFAEFYADMGNRPPGTTIDRIDNNGNYEPGNCKWSTRKEQARNRRSSRILTVNGRSMCLAEWAEETGISRQVIGTRVRKGWCHEEAVSVAQKVYKKRQRAAT